MGSSVLFCSKPTKQFPSMQKRPLQPFNPIRGISHSKQSDGDQDCSLFAIRAVLHSRSNPLQANLHDHMAEEGVIDPKTSTDFFGFPIRYIRSYLSRSSLGIVLVSIRGDWEKRHRAISWFLENEGIFIVRCLLWYPATLEIPKNTPSHMIAMDTRKSKLQVSDSLQDFLLSFHEWVARFVLKKGTGSLYKFTHVYQVMTAVSEILYSCLKWN